VGLAVKFAFGPRVLSDASVANVVCANSAKTSANIPIFVFIFFIFIRIILAENLVFCKTRQCVVSSW
jgi:hypothetical protein